ncbi:hypothetical protein [Ferroplasma sp.]|uniref:hypothetical protein n=1 Tax=Ferroplasma sp. TaxID=2591003 RepID=UPI002634EAEC|nr:hypothetical protein [Ferroplasma sp.]
MEVEDMISVQKIYLDAKGSGRIYIPEEIMGQLGWKHHERLVIVQDDNKLSIVLEENYQNKVKV